MPTGPAIKVAGSCERHGIVHYRQWRCERPILRPKPITDSVYRFIVKKIHYHIKVNTEMVGIKYDRPNGFLASGIWSINGNMSDLISLPTLQLSFYFIGSKWNIAQRHLDTAKSLGILLRRSHRCQEVGFSCRWTVEALPYGWKVP